MAESNKYYRLKDQKSYDPLLKEEQKDILNTYINYEFLTKITPTTLHEHFERNTLKNISTYPINQLKKGNSISEESAVIIFAILKKLKPTLVTTFDDLFIQDKSKIGNEYAGTYLQIKLSDNSRIGGIKILYDGSRRKYIMTGISLGFDYNLRAKWESRPVQLEKKELTFHFPYTAVMSEDIEVEGTTVIDFQNYIKKNGLITGYFYDERKDQGKIEFYLDKINGSTVDNRNFEDCIRDAAALNFILTGGSGSYKTTILSIFSELGASVVQEQAIEIINQLIVKYGVEEQKRWRQKNQSTFQAMIFDAYMELAKKYESDPKPMLFDRGPLDPYAYCLMKGVEPAERMKKDYGKSHITHVFVLPTPEDFIERPETGRTSSKTDSQKQRDYLINAYLKAGYIVTEVPSHLDLMGKIAFINNIAKLVRPAQLEPVTELDLYKELKKKEKIHEA